MVGTDSVNPLPCDPGYDIGDLQHVVVCGISDQNRRVKADIRKRPSVMFLPGANGYPVTVPVPIRLLHSPWPAPDSP